MAISKPRTDAVLEKNGSFNVFFSFFENPGYEP
jgi:hypothetical protein